MNDKLKNGQISQKVYENACKDIEDHIEYNRILSDLGISLTWDEITEKMKNYPKNALLRSEQYIGI